MDALTHLFLPLTVCYVVYREVFTSPVFLIVGVFGLFPDADKFLGIPGLLHSLVALLPLGITCLAVEYSYRGRLKWSPVIVALVGSHLVLDFIDGGPVPLLFPLVETGIGLRYPAQTVFGQGLLGVTVDGPLFTLRSVAPRQGFNTYGFIQGAGVASALAFLVVFHWGPKPTDTEP